MEARKRHVSVEHLHAYSGALLMTGSEDPIQCVAPAMLAAVRQGKLFLQAITHRFTALYAAALFCAVYAHSAQAGRHDVAESFRQRRAVPT